VVVVLVVVVVPLVAVGAAPVVVVASFSVLPLPEGVVATADPAGDVVLVVAALP
jgi:hypothetical protein